MSGLGDRDEGVRQDEFVFRMADRQHRTRRRPDDALGDAAHQQMRHGAAAVRAHHDEVDRRRCA